MFRRCGGLAAVVVALLIGLGAPASAQDEERMLSYVVTADVGADGTVAVTERIRYHFDDPRHGIFRFIPLYYPLVHADGGVDEYDARKLEIDGPVAAMDGGEVPFVVDEDAAGADENFVLRIGDPDVQLTGDHDYLFSYRIRGLLNAPGGAPELFWNALGKDSKVPVDHAEITVTAPGPIGRVQCAVGRSGGCELAEASGNTARFAADRIYSLSAVTVTVALPGTVTVPPPIVRAKPAYAGGLRDNILHPGREAGIPGLAVSVTVLGSVLCFALLGLVFYRTRDRYFAGVIPGLVPPRKSAAPVKRRWFAQREAAAVRFDPPKGVPAALCGVILRKKADRSAVAAAVTDLAVRGHLTITEVADGFAVERIDNDGAVSNFERAILGGLSSRVVLPGERGDALKFRRALGSLPAALVDDAVRRNWFTRDPRRNRFRAAGWLLLFASLWPLVWLAGKGLLWWWAPFGLTVLILMFLPARWLAARTAVGSAILAQVLDFRRYLETAEADQLAAEERVAVFNRYLPYAQVFGLADHWTAKFAAVGAAVPESWYAGGGDTVYFAATYSSFTSTVDSSAANPITVSSSTGSSSGWSSGSSGFDGGGSGGGGGDGGGGGGAGSW
jgi:uncharacterized membrane protein YgcG